MILEKFCRICTHEIRRNGRPVGLGWLPIKERIHCNIAKLAHKSIYDTECFIYIKLKQHVVG